MYVITYVKKLQRVGVQYNRNLFYLFACLESMCLRFAVTGNDLAHNNDKTNQTFSYFSYPFFVFFFFFFFLLPFLIVTKIVLKSVSQSNKEIFGTLRDRLKDSQTVKADSHA